MSVQTGYEGIRGVLKELLRYKSAILALGILLLLLGISFYAIIFIPYDKAIEMWRGGEEMWIKNPRNALPEWWEIFVSKSLPRTIDLSSARHDTGVSKNMKQTNDKLIITLDFVFNYYYDDFPSGITIFFNSVFEKTPPIIKIYWIKPGGEEIYLKNYTLRSKQDKYYLDQDYRLLRDMLRGYIYRKVKNTNFAITIERALFLKYSGKLEVSKGVYKVRLVAEFNEKPADLDAELVIYGKVHGIAGTDHLRRPLEIALIWGTPIALAFGLTASLVTTLIQLIIATISAWYGGIVDSTIQRITEIYMVLPFLPILVMVSTFYKLDIWILLIIVIILSIFGGGIKTTRALVMQIKQYPYVEAAMAYGASNIRIIFLYIIPKILPPIVPSLIAAVPGYVFLEAALAFLGLGDPFIPTWGKIINDAQSNGALYKGLYYWVLEPSFMLILTAMAFAFLGFALDKIVNPKLREM